MAGVAPDGIVTIDTGLLDQPQLCAAFLIHHQGHAAFIDCGTSLALPRLLQALQQQQLRPEQVDWLIVTHIHLDHAAGAGALLQQLPNARLLVHPRGAPHMIAPSKLLAGAAAVYGEQRMTRMFGAMLPVDEQRVVEAQDGQQVQLGDRMLQILDTPGHALHHICISDPHSGAIFTGDTFGLSYRALDSVQGAFVFPTTTPVQFDPEALHRSVDRLMAQQPERFYLTHYGAIAASPALRDDLHRRIDGLANIALDAEAIAGPHREQTIRSRMEHYLIDELHAHQCPLPDTRIREIIDMDLHLNAQGLEVWLQRRARQREKQRP